jgi:hypothetical protein
MSAARVPSAVVRAIPNLVVQHTFAVDPSQAAACHCSFPLVARQTRRRAPATPTADALSVFDPEVVPM